MLEAEQQVLGAGVAEVVDQDGEDGRRRIRQRSEDDREERVPVVLEVLAQSEVLPPERVEGDLPGERGAEEGHDLDEGVELGRGRGGRGDELVECLLEEGDAADPQEVVEEGAAVGLDDDVVEEGEEGVERRHGRAAEGGDDLLQLRGVDVRHAPGEVLVELLDEGHEGRHVVLLRQRGDEGLAGLQVLRPLRQRAEVLGQRGEQLHLDGLQRGVCGGRLDELERVLAPEAEELGGLRGGEGGALVEGGEDEDEVGGGVPEGVEDEVLDVQVAEGGEDVPALRGHEPGQELEDGLDGDGEDGGGVLVVLDEDEADDGDPRGDGGLEGLRGEGGGEREDLQHGGDAQAQRGPGEGGAPAEEDLGQRLPGGEQRGEQVGEGGGGGEDRGADGQEEDVDDLALLVRGAGVGAGAGQQVAAEEAQGGGPDGEDEVDEDGLGGGQQGEVGRGEEAEDVPQREGVGGEVGEELVGEMVQQ